MLVVTRRVGQKILIGDDIVLCVTRITRGKDGGFKARIGIDAPKHVSIWREELVQPKSLKIDPEIVEP